MSRITETTQGLRQRGSGKGLLEQIEEVDDDVGLF